MATFKCELWQWHRWLQRCCGPISSVSSKSSFHLWYTLKPERGAATPLQQLLPASFSFTAQGLFYASSSFSHPDFPAPCHFSWSWKKHRRKMPSASGWHTAFLGSAGSFWFIQQALVGWALSHSPGTCSCCCSSGWLRSISIKHQRSNTGCQAGGKKIEKLRVLLVWKKKKNTEKDAGTLSPALLIERCAINLCISWCYFTMGCLSGTGYKHQHPSVKDLKNSVAAGDHTVLFSQKAGRIITWDSQSWEKLCWWFRAGVCFTKLALDHTLFSHRSWGGALSS